MQGTIAASMLVAMCLFASTTRAATEPPVPVVETTYISAPQQSAEYTLIETTNYTAKGELLAGVGLRYRDPLLPAMTADIYIYPTGETESIEQLEKTFRGSVALAAKAGLYSKVVWDQSAPYDLTRRDGSHWRGRVVDMRVRHKGVESASRTYLFHHGLYAYKLRLDVPIQQVDELPAAADAMLRAVLPPIKVVSVGSCGKEENIQVIEDHMPMPSGYVDGVSPDGFGIALHQSDLEQPASAGTSAQAMLASPLVQRTVLAKQRQIASGCTTPPYEPEHKNVSVLKIHFPADFWRTDTTHRKP